MACPLAVTHWSATAFADSGGQRLRVIQYLNMLHGLFRRYPSNNERLKRSVTYSETYHAFAPVVLLVAI